MNNQQDRIRASFTTQASGFSDPGLTLSNQKYIKWMTDSLPLKPEMNVLDLACGTGIMSRALAPFVRSVIGIDVTPPMLSQARVFAENEGLLNVEFHECPAENTGFSPETFDLSVTRFSLHHFERPMHQLLEMVRVTKNEGCVAVIDLIAPSDPQMAVRYNEYERLRDPSHTIALSKDPLEELIAGAKLTIREAKRLEVHVNVGRWLALTKAPAITAERIVSDLEAEIEGRGPATGLSPSRDASGELVFQQQWLIIVGIKK
jgi:ubiquinone/menaquinone biosynthesis C-methylase UbiE